jgi:hypothetical protein
MKCEIWIPNNSSGLLRCGKPAIAKVKYLDSGYVFAICAKHKEECEAKGKHGIRRRLLTLVAEDK